MEERGRESIACADCIDYLHGIAQCFDELTVK